MLKRKMRKGGVASHPHWRLLWRLQVRPCRILLRPVPVRECRLTEQRRFVTDSSRLVENHDQSPTARPKMHGLKQPYLSLVVNHSLNCFDHGHIPLQALYRKPDPLRMRLTNSCYTSRMEIMLQLPEDVAQHLAAQWRDLPRAALESLALEGYRSGALTQSQLRRMLGFQTRMEVDGFLKEHGVHLEYTLEDLDREAESSRRAWQKRQAELAGEANNKERQAG